MSKFFAAEESSSDDDDEEKSSGSGSDDDSEEDSEEESEEEEKKPEVKAADARPKGMAAFMKDADDDSDSDDDSKRVVRSHKDRKWEQMTDAITELKGHLKVRSPSLASPRAASAASPPCSFGIARATRAR